jgi:Icc-related predicted phosphoesterase
MKIAYASDLHLEFSYELILSGLTSVDVLVLAGDIDTMPEAYTDIIHKIRSCYNEHIILVMGNHEYYNGEFPSDREKYRMAVAHDTKVHVLENQSIIINGVKFLGATLWTDFASSRQKRACQRMMADFDVIFDGKSGSLSPDTILEVHQDTINWLDDQFTNHPHDGKNVVITHHAPSFRSQNPIYADSPISGGFCSSQDQRILRWKPNIWIHGHVHDKMDYYIGSTMVLCNPWGYESEQNTREYAVISI